MRFELFFFFAVGWKELGWRRLGVPRAEPHAEGQGELRVFRRMTRDPARNNTDALGTVRGR